MPTPTPPGVPKTSNKNKPATIAGEKSLSHLKQWHGEHDIAVGLSGGVDSSLTAALLVQAGWNVEGLTLWLMSGKGACCSDGLIDAAAICKQLNIIHHVVDSRSTFQKEIVNELVKGYEQGITPLPCSRCNRSVKFSEMINWANKNRNIKYIATGHYARIRYKHDQIYLSSLPKNGTYRNQLLRGIDRNKDQSYFLYDLDQELLGNILFPLGELTKEDTRKEANKLGLKTAEKAESQDLCLAEHHGSMKAFLDKYLKPRKGSIVLKDGSFLGEHDGIEHFTIGQRKGLGISWKEPLHVIELDPKENIVVVAPREQARKSSCIVGKVNWVSIAAPEETIEVEVQLRYRSKPILAKLTPITPTQKDLLDKRPNRCKLIFSNDQFSITPGQAAVFYSGDILLGGGLIERN